ncbi:ATP-binding protein [Streptomyces sp. RFCAC02]|uniref:ATP-binding protein n=1 Tax=Streptomyces sp. RFCAC02 TaxID=2499143 RepID=UPI001020E185|nr:ATP-binding protein [Streptomyces sp. RFCAC02]
MKKSTARSLGTVALGAAFVATAAGTAAASGLPVGGVQDTASGVVRTLPAHDVARTLPAGGQLVESGSDMLAGAGQVTSAHETLSATQGGDPVGQLLGGLPTNQVLGSALPL